MLSEGDRAWLKAHFSAINSRLAEIEADIINVRRDLAAVSTSLETLDIHVHQVLDKELHDIAHDAAAAVETANNVARDHNMQQVERLEKQERKERERVKTGGGE